MLQDLCRDKLGWDDVISEKYQRLWAEWQKNLPLLEKLNVSRCFKPEWFVGKEVSCQLHHFSDASEIGYGTVSYLRLEDENGNINSSLVFGKSRVAPLKQITIPRMKLTAAALAVKINNMILKELEYDVTDVCFWTDSTAVLRYIANDTARYHTFVANRVNQIRECTQVEQWRHIEGKMNPADIASRGLSFKDVSSGRSDLWLNGPSFLTKPESEWPELINLSPDFPDDEEELKTVASILSNEEDSVLKIYDYHSSWSRLNKCIAWLLRVKDYLRSRFGHGSMNHTSQRITKEEMDRAEMAIVKHLQNSHFRRELEALNAGKCVPGNSSISQLDSILDVNGMIRVGGRLRRANLDYDVRHPLLIPKETRIGKLMIIVISLLDIWERMLSWLT
ncbi:uncharacterized protein LOC141909273 [Tubulanus polymorphus]|uniref:uncharacterized protein LOC141909273 n=1 Tax=Tubulanus polymorphus TaxID=672921 RepID=UPI003DA540B1